MLDVTIARNRRRFYLDRGLRKKPIGAGSDLERLMRLQRRPIDLKISELLNDIPWTVVGGIATRAYMPERTTSDVDILVEHARFDEVCGRLESDGWKPGNDLVFPDASLGLRGTAWTRESELDILSSGQAWANEALSVEAYDQTGLRVVALPYLVLMKLDAARGIDQGDLSRMLGRLDDAQLENLIAVVGRHLRDPQAMEDIRQYAQLGRWELERPKRARPDQDDTTS